VADVAEDPRCPACGADPGRRIPYPGGAGHEARGGLRFDAIVLCPRCGLGLAEPRPRQDALDAFYASGAYWHASGGSPAQRAHESNQARRRVLRCLPHLRGAGPAADVGAGHGAIAEWLERLAADRVERYDFVEPDPGGRAEIAARRRRFPVVDATQAGLRDGYALLFLNHVLEHVADPADFLARAAARLRPDGLLYIETPNADQRFKDDVFPHTLFFTPAALRALAARAGLEVLACATFGAHPGMPGAIGPFGFRWLNAALSRCARAGLAPAARWLDDRIWRYRDAEDGMWLCCLARPRKSA